MKKLFTYCFFIVAGISICSVLRAQSYCSSYLTSYEYITNVTFQEIDNTTEYVDGEPADYTDLGPANVAPGESYPLSVTLEPDADDYITVYIDWNQNGTLDDAGEEYVVVEATSSAGPHTIDIDVPADALPGETRMRVILVWDDIPTPCYDAFSGYGEAEDYTVNVAAGCETPSSVSVSAVTGTSVSLDWVQSGAPEGWLILYGESGFDPGAGGMSVFTDTKPYMLEGLSLATAYDVYIQAVCSADDSSGRSAVTAFTTLCVLPSVTGKKDSSNCGPGAITLEATASPGAVIKWYASLSDYEPLATGNSYTTPVLSEDAVYYAAASGPTSCESSEREAILAQVLELPEIDLSDTFVCPGGAVILDAGNPGSTYLWSTGAATQTITVSDTGLYSVTVVSQDNCSAMEEITVGLPPTAAVAGFNFVPRNDIAPGTVSFAAIDPVNVLSYEWDFGDGSPLSYEEMPVHTYAVSGNYTVVLRVLNGCEGSEVSLPISVDLPTGLVTLAQPAAGIRVYPNPAKEVMYIDGQGQMMREVRLYNAVGRLVRRADMHTRSYAILVAGLSAGVYFLQVATDKGTTAGKIEIQP